MVNVNLTALQNGQSVRKRCLELSLKIEFKLSPGGRTKMNGIEMNYNQWEIDEHLSMLTGMERWIKREIKAYKRQKALNSLDK